MSSENATPLSAVAATSREVVATSGRLRKISLLAELLRRLGPEEIEIGVGYLVGELRQGKIGLGYASLRDLKAQSAGTPRLTLLEADRRFEDIAQLSGKGANEARRRLLAELFGRATREEQEFLARLLLGELRQGALEGVMAEAVARAAGLPLSEVHRAQMLAGRLAPVARAALTEGAPGLARFRLAPLAPVQPMLAQTAEGPAEALADLGEAALEWKLDGARVQVHKAAGEVRVYTRSLHEVGARVPEIVEAVQLLPVQSLILDGEVLALGADGRPQPFQVTMRRITRRLEVESMRRQLPLSAFYFDCLHLDGEDLIGRGEAERFAALAGTLPPALLMPRLVTADAHTAEDFLRDALARGHEGIMAKALNAPYEAGNRGASWLKVKPALTLDLVVLAAEWGSGRRQGWLSNLHLGARDPQTGGFVMLGKTFKGLTDAMLEWQTKKLLELEIGREDYVVHVRPELVVEIAFNEVQTSPRYPAGLALRFARVKRYRMDKRAEQADTIDAVRAIHQRQRAREAAETDA
jgi:DNA ligase 1